MSCFGSSIACLLKLMSLPLITIFLVFLASVNLVAAAMSLSVTDGYTASTIYFYLVGILTWVAASRAWIRRPHPLNIRLSYLMSLGLMNVCSVGAVYQLGEGGWASHLVPITQFLTSAFLPAIFLHCFLIVPAPIPHVSPRVRQIIYLPAFFFCFAWLIRYYQGIEYQRSFFLISIRPFREPSLIYFTIYMFAVLGCLIYNRIKAPTRAQQRQSKWLLIGITTGLLPVSYLVSVPEILGFDPPLGEYPAYTLILILIFYIVAIIRHRLMDIELMLNKSAVYAIVSSLAIGTYLLGIQIFNRIFPSLVGPSDMVFDMLSVLMVAVLFAPVKGRVQNWIDRAFYREQYNYRQTLLRLSRTLSFILSLQELADTILTEVSEAMHIRNAVLYIREDDQFNVQATQGCSPQQAEVSSQDPWFRYLQDVQMPLRTRALPGSEVSTAMTRLQQQINPEVWVPFLLQDQLIAVLILGEKLSEEPYTHEDLSLLGTLMHQGAVAIQNALLYEQLRIRTEALETARMQLMQTYVDTYGGTPPESHRDDVVADFQNIAMALKQSYERLKELDELKTQFVSNVSHELGTPLTHIKGFVDNLLQGIGGPLTDKQKRYLSRIVDNCDRLIRLINDLLDLSRIESGNIGLYPTQVRLIPLIEDVVQNMQDIAQTQQIQLASHHAHKGLTIWADPDKLKQILVNLLDNALKFTDPGGRVTLITEQINSQMIAIHVEDTGIGISGEELDRIFERFHQTQGTKDRGIHGTGLGLSIAKSLVELHDGEMKVESTVGKGSRFSIVLPRQPQKRAVIDSP